ncbi:MAG TPA: ATP-binding protein [Acidimicrobiia bacterium]
MPRAYPFGRSVSLKLRLAILLLGAVALTDAVFYALIKERHVWPGVAGAVAATLTLFIVWFVSRGTLEPLREMADASEAIARGELETRVAVTTKDEIGRLAESFNRMAIELEQTDGLRRDLVANVSHELRTPITALQAKLENLVDGVEQPDLLTMQTMLAQTQRLGRLVIQLLDLSRLESGAVPLDRQEFVVAPMLELAVRESQLGDPHAHIALHVEPPDLVIDGDPERLHQVVANLVENAVRYSPNGGTVSVEAGATPHGVCIAVADEGPGIPDHEAVKVFERFYRSDYARSSRDGGAGLGLAIARWIVDLHGGEILPTAVQPHGCRMVVNLPTHTSTAPRTGVPA